MSILKGKIKVLAGSDEEREVPCVQYGTLEDATGDLGEDECLKRINRTVLTDAGNKARAAIRRGGEVKAGAVKKSTFVVD